MHLSSWKAWAAALGAASMLVAAGCAFKAAGDQAKPAPGSPAAQPSPPRPGLTPPADANQAKVELGKFLFFDHRLSGDHSVSCATCHAPDKAWADGAALSAGYKGTAHFRNTPTLLNATKNYARLDWDGRFTSSDLDSLVRDRITESHFGMADGRLVIERLRQVPEYEAYFKAAYGGEPTLGRFLGAISAFVRTLNTGKNGYDRYQQGDTAALSSQARDGLELFKGKAACIQCHAGPNLTDGKFHSLGVPGNPDILNDPLRIITMRKFLRTHGVPGFQYVDADPGLYAITHRPEDTGKFRTPSLREVGKTAPYMHNGMLRALADVVEFYDQGGGQHPNKDPLLKPLGLTAQEKQALVAFLMSLSGEDPEVQVPAELPQYQPRTLGSN